MRPRSFTDRDLLDTARACFLEHGPSVSTSHIAKELGVSQAALFKRFPTKRELLVAALVPQEAPAWIFEVAKGPDERPVRAQLEAHAHRIDAFFGAMVPCWAVIRAAGLLPEDLISWGDTPPPVMAHRMLSRWFGQLADQGRAHVPDPAATALSFIASLQSPHMLRHMLGDKAPSASEDYVDRVVDLMWRAIAPDAFDGAAPAPNSEV